ncbi:MAG: hypothetical protein FJZ95_04880 [Chloroflexi bacterium]|nr:hypothetical protein [Chloroflexota bacterium]
MRFSVKAIPVFLVLMLALSSLLACSSDGKDSTPSPSEKSLWTGDPTVKTAYGSVKGFPDRSETWVWKAIPYAKPPVGESRWETPQNPDLWDGTRAETEFCEPCSQYSPIAPNTIIGSEDCLYLNVWRPRTEETNLPVYVWIHGGGNSGGSASDTTSNVASKSNMVFVSMNYRLGPLG